MGFRSIATVPDKGLAWVVFKKKITLDDIDRMMQFAKRVGITRVLVDIAPGTILPDYPDTLATAFRIPQNMRVAVYGATENLIKWRYFQHAANVRGKQVRFFEDGLEAPVWLMEDTPVKSVERPILKLISA